MHNDLKEITTQLVNAATRIKDEQAFIKDAMKSAKDKGYDVKALKKTVNLILNDAVTSESEHLKLVDTYLSNVGQPTLF